MTDIHFSICAKTFLSAVLRMDFGFGGARTASDMAGPHAVQEWHYKREEFSQKKLTID
jgi:hypothetical protein